MITALWLLGLAWAGLMVFAGLLHILKHLGPAGQRWAQRVAYAPWLDVVVFVFTVLPQLIAIGLGIALHAGILGTLLWLASAVVGQCLALVTWMRLHEWKHREAMRGPRITSTLNRTVGAWRNVTAVWWTAWAVPLFALVRAAELLIYPPLTWLVRLPRYNHRDWVNVSRHKFDGLVGSDRIWCLYCDWMTGVWSLGSEMLRNVESFWCPIRFASPEKCVNCRTDFPDVAGGWVSSDAGMAEVTQTLEQHYPGPPDDKGRPVNAWFSHPVRLTVKGKEPTSPTPPDDAAQTLPR
jgi:hypothetical protein